MFVPNHENQQKLGRILVLSDAAHSVGAEYKGKKTGCLTDITVFSFHAVKNLTTAEGGAVCLCLPEPFNNEAEYNYLCTKSLHGQSKDALAKMQPGNWRYDIIEPGYKCNMTDIMAAIGLVELKRYENDMLIRRKAIFDKYTDLLSKHDFAIIPTYHTADKTTSYHVFTLRIKGATEAQRDEIIKLVFERQVSVNVHFIPVPMMTCYKKMGYKIEDYPQTYANYCCEISLPVYYDLTDEQVETVVNAVVFAVNQAMKHHA
jgi:dTDP-4-amino-4,6-dideoxygalactose transaminase